MTEVVQDAQLEELLQRGFRYALSLTHDEDRAADLLQDAWISMLRRGAPRHVGYLFATLRNRFFDLEKRRRLVAIEPLDAVSEHDDALAFLDQASHFAEMGTLEKALEDLRPAEREALFLAAVEGYTVREIADMTEQPKGTVSSLVQRARRKLKSWLGADRPAQDGEASA